MTLTKEQISSLYEYQDSCCEKKPDEVFTAGELRQIAEFMKNCWILGEESVRQQKKTKSDKEIKDEIAQTEKDFATILNQHKVSIEVNTPVAMMQAMALTKLDVLYWAVGLERPRFPCDKTFKELEAEKKR